MKKVGKYRDRWIEIIIEKARKHLLPAIQLVRKKIRMKEMKFVKWEKELEGKHPKTIYKENKKIIIGLICLLLVLQMYRNELHAIFQPYFSYKQCLQHYSGCDVDGSSYARADLKRTRAYFKEIYGISPRKVDRLGTKYTGYGNNDRITYVYRVELFAGHSFIFHKERSTAKLGRDIVSHDYAQVYDDTQRFIAGVFYEIVHGHAYPEINEILEQFELSYFENDYVHNQGVRMMYQGDKNMVAPYYQDSFDEQLAIKMKKYISRKGQSAELLAEIMHDIEQLEWSKILYIMGYTDNTDKRLANLLTYNYEERGTDWSVEVSAKIKQIPQYEGILIDVGIEDIKDWENVLKWQ
ncbi:hypothetical protein AwErysi_09510 [Erysipelotrichaceae bacterium]|nr:hypothetical protein AwErysi_09510 [Erysipelotrichaceae bacterium]